eukprot:6368608-Prymnesium_polylepis.1
MAGEPTPPPNMAGGRPTRVHRRRRAHRLCLHPQVPQAGEGHRSRPRAPPSPRRAAHPAAAAARAAPPQATAARSAQ